MGLKGFRTSSRTLLLGLGLTLACATAAHADTWKPGDLTSYSQLGWAQSGSSTLTNGFFSVYTTGAADVGGPFVMEFTSPQAILAYLPSSGVRFLGIMNTTF